MNDTLKYAMLIEYDGTHFNGTQKQLGGRTVQEEIENALKTVLRMPVKIVFSGRTDTGVSALGQVAHFEYDATEKLELHKFIYSLNGVLPPDIAVRDVEITRSSFHARKSALKRWYRYVIYNNAYRSAMFSKALFEPRPLSEELMHQALQQITGTNDFSSFKSSNSDTSSAICTIHKAHCFRDKNFIYIDIIANRYVYNMVRILVGTLLDTGLKKTPVSHLATVLNQHDRTKAGITAKPEGLTLMAIEYPEEFSLFENDKFMKVRDIMLKNFMESKNEDIFRKAS
jgi:tRNA pseudouridine38-40 synthase